MYFCFYFYHNKKKCFIENEKDEKTNVTNEETKKDGGSNP